MRGHEIFNLITEKKSKIEDLFDPTSFVLNPEVVKLEKEIEELQTECEHNYVEGVCEYCGKENQ
jgi:hypothetical protein